MREETGFYKDLSKISYAGSRRIWYHGPTSICVTDDLKTRGASTVVAGGGDRNVNICRADFTEDGGSKVLSRTE